MDMASDIGKFSLWSTAALMAILGAWVIWALIG
jgi:hypothetical protein